MRQLLHDAFGRFAVYSERVYTQADCAYCGQRKQTPTGRSFLFRYSQQADGIYTRRESVSRLFCSISCLRCVSH